MKAEFFKENKFSSKEKPGVKQTKFVWGVFYL